MYKNNQYNLTNEISWIKLNTNTVKCHSTYWQNLNLINVYPSNAGGYPTYSLSFLAEGLGYAVQAATASARHPLTQSHWKRHNAAHAAFGRSKL